jgi:hypothetical protein
VGAVMRHDRLRQPDIDPARIRDFGRGIFCCAQADLALVVIAAGSAIFGVLYVSLRFLSEDSEVGVLPPGVGARAWPQQGERRQAQSISKPRILTNHSVE